MSTIAISVYYLFDIIIWAIIIKSLFTWIPNGTDNKLYSLLYTFTYPIEKPIRDFTYKYNTGPFDFSPVVSIMVLTLLKRIAYMVLI